MLSGAVSHPTCSDVQSSQVDACCTGSAAMRTRLLEARGWQVVAVPFFEWNQACERDRQLDYLWSKLPGHLATRGASRVSG